MNNKIARRLTLYFALVLLLFALVVGVLFSFMFARHTTDVMARDLRAHTVSIADTLTKFTASLCKGTCEGGGFKAYMRFAGDFAMSDIYLLDSACQAVSLGGMPLSSAPLPEGAGELVRTVFETGDVAVTPQEGLSFLQRNMIAGAPVMHPDGGVQYALLLSSPVGSSSHALRDAFYILAACLGIALVLAIAMSDFLSHRFVTPLHRMMEAAVHLTGGDYRARTGVRQSDEIGILAEQIDLLAVRLDEAQAQRHQLDRMRQDFFSDISHELRTPIAVLKGSVELLRDGLIDDPEQRKEALDQLYGDATHIERLINDLLELTRLQNTQFRIDMDVVNLADILSDSVRFMTQRAAAKDIAVTLDNPCGPFPVMGDYTRLRQLMIILLDNAVKFSPEHTAVRITARRSAGICEVTVADQGCGIDSETLSHIFDRFFHSRLSLNHSGTGLGLPIAKEIALRHGIDISCRSAPGEGACFTLVFPECEIPQE